MNKITDTELIEELRIRMAEKTSALEELKILNMKLEESEKLKSHFISNITNEIVNPFSSILGLSKNILSVDKENWKKVFSMVAMIHSEAFSLDFQLKNIFAAARIEAGEMYPEIGKVDISNMINVVLESFRIESQKKKLTFKINFQKELGENSPREFRTDPEKLKLILSNLVSNAVKFSYENSLIKINSAILDGSLVLSVLNTGIEISDEHKQFIFDRFKRADSDITSVNRGHGLGLSIIKSVLDLLGGNVSFISDKLNGTIFTITIPEAPGENDSFTTSLNGNEMFFEDDQVF
jgi:signal transduction histidine kinase